MITPVAALRLPSIVIAFDYAGLSKDRKKLSENFGIQHLAFSRNPLSRGRKVRLLSPAAASDRAVDRQPPRTRSGRTAACCRISPCVGLVVAWQHRTDLPRGVVRVASLMRAAGRAARNRGIWNTIRCRPRACASATSAWPWRTNHGGCREQSTVLGWAVQQNR
jgi:hypothetical protein